MHLSPLIVMVQYTVNDNNPADAGGITDLPVMENEWRRGFERLVRKLMKLPSKPALHYLHVYQPSYMGHSFWLSAEMEIETILQYYSIPTVSARNALYELLLEEAHGFSEAEVHCGVHPNPLGHRCVCGTAQTLPPCLHQPCQLMIRGNALALQPAGCCLTYSRGCTASCNTVAGTSWSRLTQDADCCRYYADMVIANLQDHAHAALTVPEEHMAYPEGFAGLQGIPPPMLEQNWDFDSECLTGELLHQAVVPQRSQVGSCTYLELVCQVG